jgi:simple sugar transport system substrate-binding protein
MKSLLAKLAIATAVIAAPMMTATTASAEGERYVLVSHAPDSDSWWNTIKNGIALAGEQMGVEVEYRNPPTGDIADMARIIEQAAASGPNGIITTLADFDVLSGPIYRCSRSGHQRHHHEHRHAGPGPRSWCADVCRSAGI